MEVIKGKSSKTASEYRYDLITFFRFLKINRGLIPCPAPNKDFRENFSKITISDVSIDLLKEVTLSELYEYLSFVNKYMHNESCARARKVSSLRSFFKYMTVRAGKLLHNPAENLESPKVAKKQPKYLTLSESQLLLQNIPKDEHFARNLCIITLFLNCGIRISELVGINISSIRDETITILGKGNKERTVYLNKACLCTIDNYLRVRPADGVVDKDALFISRNKKRISTKTVWCIVKKCLESAGLDSDRYSPHKLRHTAATLLYQYAEADLLIIKQILGHESLATTQIYTHLNDENAKYAIKKNPLSGE
ncbi:MAG: tyrosine recombinase XerC [Clostridia bacterium]|nr:tyrosine recombinase XerC [Clostridia bacterium]